MNTITIHGNVTADPILRYTDSGRAIASFTIATNSRRYDRTRDRWIDQPPVFHRISAFGALAENITESITKGTSVAVTGEFVDASYIPTGSDHLRRAIQINATDVAISLRFATATITRNPRTTTATATGEQPVTEPTVEQPAQPRVIRGVNKAPRGPQLRTAS